MKARDHAPNGMERAIGRMARVLLAVLLLMLAAGAQCSRSDTPGGAGSNDADRLAPPTGETIDDPVFADASSSRKLVSRHHDGRGEDYFFPEIMAGGAAFLDFDNDGDLDVYLVNGADSPTHGNGEPPAAKRPANRLYRQESDGSFVDVSGDSGADDDGYGMGVAVGDVNNDGLPDLYVSNYGPDRLLLNLGEGKFQDVTEAAGIDNPNWGCSAAMLDFDRDGWLDIVVTNYVDYDPTRPCIDGRGVQDYCNPQIFPGTSDRLFRNLSGERAEPVQRSSDSASDSASVPVKFADVSLRSGIALSKGAGLGVTALDVNDDQWPDIYVANDGEANRLWVNQKDGTFQDEAILLGAAYDLLGQGQASMGIGVGDVDRNRRFDLFLTHLDGEHNALYLAQDNGLFREHSNGWNLAATSFPYTGFGTVFADFDQDGNLDLAIANGRVIRPDSAPAADDEFWQPYAEPNQLFLNRSGTMVAVRSQTDAFLQDARVSRALVQGDVDNDGDIDLLVGNLDGPLQLLENQFANPGHWLMLRVVDPRYGNRDAYGAVVEVTAGEHRWARLVQPGSSYLSSHDPRVHFGLGEIDQVDAVVVRWPDGQVESFPGGAVNEHRTLQYGAGTVETSSADDGKE